MIRLATLLLGMLLLHSTIVCTLNKNTTGDTVDFEHVITINPQYGKDTDNCISGEESCRTLSWAFKATYRRSSTKYFLEKGTHFLNSSTDLFNKSLSSLAFVGNASNSSHVIIHCTAENSGLAFEGVKAVTFSYLTFYNCSAMRNSTTRDYRGNSSSLSAKFHDFQVGLYFYLCTDVTMLFVNVSDSPNATGVVMYDTNGTNVITNSTFQNNIISKNTTITPSPNGGGGGFYVEFTYCKPGNKACNNDQENVATITGAKYQFLHCTFQNNQAHDSSSDKGTYLVEFESDHVAFGRGGGLSIYVKGDSYDNVFEIVHCDFERNNATWGGGMLAEFQDHTANNTLHIVNSSFINNECYYTPTSGTGGGGMRLGHCVYHKSKYSVQGNIINIDNCHFSENKALNGGGLSISVARQDTTSDKLAQINITHGIFFHNTARLGSAVHIDGFALILLGLVADVHMTRPFFEANTAEYLIPLDLENHESLPYQAGLGAVYVHEVNLMFHESATFYKNIGSALAAVHTRLCFRDCNATFSGNHGNKGGAIALLGGSFLMIDENTQMTFDDNNAMVQGGAIYNTYISRENMDSYSHCFIRHTDAFRHPDDWGTKFTFQGNIHMCGSRQNSIYSTSILPCSWAGGVGVNANKHAIFCWEGWSYTNISGDPVECKTQISTDAGEITFTTPDKSNVVQAFPGHEFKLDIDIKDDLGRDVSEQTVFVAVTNTTGSTLGVNGNLYSYVWGESATVWGEEEDRIILTLDSVEDRVWHLEVTIELMPCPPGFKEANTTQEEDVTEATQLQCTCANLYGGVLLCDNKNFSAMLRNSNWMGRLQDDDDDDDSSQYLSSPCPPGYCTSNPTFSHFFLPNNSESLDNLTCGSNNRRGVLCGQCIKGFEPAVNSPTYECVNCTDVNVVASVFKYIAIVYIPIIIIFVVIIIFGVRLTSGPANAFILYSQVISSTFNLDADGQIPLALMTGDYRNGLLKAYRVPYGIFNLEFLENLISPFCIGTGLDTLTVISLEYAVAFVPLLMIFIAVIVVKIASLTGDRCCNNNNNNGDRSQMFTASAAFIAKHKRGLSESLLPAFAAFLLLSYTKFSLTSAYILNQQYLVDENGTRVPPARVYYSGHLDVHNKDYIIPYFIPALIFFVVFVLIPPLLLLHYPIRIFEWCLEKVHFLWRFYPATKVHVLLDTFQGCFKIKYRFFAGLYFLFRLVININIMLTESWLQQYIVQQTACVIIVMLIAVCQPYNKENDIFNRIDAFIFTNLAVINAISLYLYEYSQNNPQANTLPVSAFAFQYILVYLPLFYIIVYVIWDKTRPCHKAWRRSAKEKTRNVLSKWNVNSYKRLDNMMAESEVSSTLPASLVYQPNINEGFEESEEIMFRRAEMENTYRPRSRLVTIVEAHGQEGEASLIHTTTSEDSGLRSVQSSPAYYYGSTGDTGHSTSSRSSLRNSGQNHQDNDSKAEGHETRHSSKSYRLQRNNSGPESESRRKTS